MESPALVPSGYQLVPRQLPASIGDFTGRESSICEIKEILTETSHVTSSFSLRIVAISGRAGVGKSSLAIRAAHEVSEDFPDGNLYADIQGNGDQSWPELLTGFLHALGVVGSAVPEDIHERSKLYRSKLANKRLLIVLDAVMSEEQVMPLLPGSPTCAVITTSRVQLSGLPSARWIDIDVLDATQSNLLLTSILGHGRVESERESAAELVSFCGGLPLALRIAGARLASKPHWRISTLVRKLEGEARTLDVLSHRGLEVRSSISITYRSLDDRAKQLFRRCAMVRGPDFPAWIAAAVLDIGLDEAEDVLEKLVDARALDVVDNAAEQSMRYRFHSLLHAYAEERLVEDEQGNERDAVLARILGAWMSLAEQAHRREYGGDFTVLHGDAPRWMPSVPPRLDVAVDPVRWDEIGRAVLVAAIRQAAEFGFAELCWDLTLTAVNFFEIKGYFDDWRECTQLALDVCRRTGNLRGQAAMLYSMGTLHMFRKRLQDAESCYERAETMFRDVGDIHGVALVLRNAAYIEWLRQRPAEAIAKYTVALELMRTVGDRIGEAHILCNLARERIAAADWAMSQQMLDEALQICRELRCSRVEAQVLYRFADLYAADGRVELARDTLHRVLLIVRDIGDRIGEAHVLYSLGLIRYAEGRLDKAELTLVDALSLATLVGDRLVEAQSRFALAEVAIADGNTSTGVTRLNEACAMFDELGSTAWHAKALARLAEIRATMLA